MAQKLVSNVPHIEDANTVTKKLAACPNVADDLKDMYNSKFLTDVTLKTKTNSFPAHKFVLCARSPVFKVMFSNDMREKSSDSIQVDDLEDQTVKQLLLFLYSDNLEDLQWETAFELYYAADKYQVEKLKLKCSSFLIENLTTSTAPELILLADTHSDSDLKEVVDDFILNHDAQVFCSNEWEKLMKSNPQLALQTMHSIYKTKELRDENLRKSAAAERQRELSEFQQQNTPEDEVQSIDEILEKNAAAESQRELPEFQQQNTPKDEAKFRLEKAIKVEARKLLKKRLKF